MSARAVSARGAGEAAQPGGFTVALEQRDFSGPLLAPGIRWSVERLEWRAVGGPWLARLTARAASADAELLARLAELLRCGVTVCDERGPAWWGYIHAVDIHSAAGRSRASLEEMANRVAVRYREYSPTLSGGSPALTGFYEDAASAAAFGGKEKIIASGQASLREAQSMARAALAKLKRPRWVPRPGLDHGDAAPVAVVEARGWWEALDWKFAAEPRGLLANSTSGADQSFGLSGAVRVGQTFTMPADAWTVSEVWLRLRKSAPTTDSVRVELCPNANGLPGAALGTAEVAGTAVEDGSGWVRFAFAAPVAVPAGVNWLVVSRTGALSASACYVISVDQASGFSGGQVYMNNGASWSARSPGGDLNLAIAGVEETTEQIRRLLGPTRCGQFFRQVRVEAQSGVTARMYRPGSGEGGRRVVEGLLTLGDSGGGRLLARVERCRAARIYRQPGEDGAGWLRAAAGPGGALIAPDGRRLSPSEWPAGQWVRLGGTGGNIFVERCAWEPGRGVFLIKEDGSWQG